MAGEGPDHRSGEDAEERYHESVRLYDHAAIETALADAGWEIASVHGDFSGAVWRSGTGPRMIVVGRREASV